MIRTRSTVTTAKPAAKAKAKAKPEPVKAAAPPPVSAPVKAKKKPAPKRKAGKGKRRAAPKPAPAPKPQPKAKPEPKAEKPNAGGATPKLTAGDVPRVIAIMRANGGIKTAAAEKLNVSRRTLYNFLDEHPEVKEAAAEIDEELLDIAEGRVVQAISAGEMQTVRWYLEMKGKGRGFVRRVENTGKDGGPVETRAAPDLSGYSEQELAQLVAVEEARQKREAGARPGK
ncbi:helix-turn-helix domain-containing protein [Mesorhizobium sp. M0058]|uniref:helix-turn-helix domain-containing protein n=1 Tax=Mesorhizobium sp. M0058 TaxID=2956865 RepID=UPI00333D6481